MPKFKLSHCEIQLRPPGAELLDAVNLDHAAGDIAGGEQDLKAVDGTKAAIPETVYLRHG
jgi:hypothetical protein